MACPAWLPSISRHGSGNLWKRQCLGKMPCMCVCAQPLSYVQLFEAPRTIACQSALSMGFPRQEYWIGLPFTSPGYFLYPEMEPLSFALQADYLPLSHWDSMDTLEYMFLNCCMLYYYFSGPLNDCFWKFCSGFCWWWWCCLFGKVLCSAILEVLLVPHSQPHNIALCCIFIRQLFCLGNHPWSKALEFWKITHFGS